MAYAVAAATIYLITIRLLPEKGQDVPTIIVNIARRLTDTNNVRFVHRFKITGEPTVVAIVEVSKASALERLLRNLYGVGTFSINSQPVITYQDFGRSLGVAEELTRPPGRILETDDLFLMEFVDDYYGNTTDELLAAWKSCIEGTLSQIMNGEIRLEVYKNLAERKESLFFNAKNTAALDRLPYEFPLTEAFGSNIYMRVKSLQFLEAYTQDVIEDDVY